MTDDQSTQPGNPRADQRPRPPAAKPAPTHPALAAALLMIGIVVFLVAVSVMAVL